MERPSRIIASISSGVPPKQTCNSLRMTLCPQDIFTRRHFVTPTTIAIVEKSQRFRLTHVSSCSFRGLMGRHARWVQKKLGEQSHKFLFIHITHDDIGLQKLLAVPGKLLNPDLQHLARQRSRIISLNSDAPFFTRSASFLEATFAAGSSPLRWASIPGVPKREAERPPPTPTGNCLVAASSPWGVPSPGASPPSNRLRTPHCERWQETDRGELIAGRLLSQEPQQGRMTFGEIPFAAR